MTIGSAGYSASRRAAEYPAFHREVYGGLRWYASNKNRGYIDGEDAAQEALKATFAAWDHISPGKRKAFAFRVVNNWSASAARRGIREREARKEQPDRINSGTDAVVDLQVTREAIFKLPKRRREFILLSIAGLSNSEIADVFCIKVESVDQELSRTRSKLRKLIGRSAVHQTVAVDGTAWEGGAHA